MPLLLYIYIIIYSNTKTANDDEILFLVDVLRK